MDKFTWAISSAFFASVALGWVMRRLAWVTGVVDVPDGARKLHRRPVPLLGGVAVFGAWLVGLAVGLESRLQPARAGTPTQADGSAAATTLFPNFHLQGLPRSWLLAAGMVLVIGVLDDLIGLRARWKLLGQLAAALALVAGGLVIKRLWLFDRTIPLGWPGIGLTLLWLVGSMNALNMIDGLDGLAATVGIVLCSALALMAWMTQAALLILVSLTFAGALAGFLVHNFPPARLFLGDAGSSLIGLVIGAVALEGSFKAPATAALAAPLLILIVPIFDGLVAVVRRRLTGKPITAPDRGHIHYYLQERGWSNLQVLAGVAGLCALTGSAALLSLYFRNQAMAVLTTGAVVIGCILTRFFGYYEYLLLLGGPRLLATALWECLQLERPIVLALCYRLRQCRSSEEIWAILTEQADALQLTEIRLQLAPPNAFQGYWKNHEAGRELPLWSANLPLLSARKTVGHLSLCGYQRQKNFLPVLIFMTVVARTLAVAIEQQQAAERGKKSHARSTPGCNARLVPGLDTRHDGENARPQSGPDHRTRQESERLSA
jgi:UDP-GlcNAc:undecaprenyl-phosphate GlcNAc-1-phosphate transferase